MTAQQKARIDQENSPPIPATITTQGVTIDIPAVPRRMAGGEVRWQGDAVVWVNLPGGPVRCKASVIVSAIDSKNWDRV